MKVLIKILKFTAGTILGLVSSFLIIWGLDSVISLDATKASHADLWLIGVFVSVCVFVCNYLFFIGSSSKKMHTPGIEHLPETISEFIDEIIDAMKYRRSVRSEVRQELTDHFTDAMADCETEEEKQTVTKELIAEFGDIELLGKLLRRAKKRCRPLWRTMVARTFQLMGLCIVLLILYIGWFFTGKPQITTNYLEILNQKVRPVADDSQNAWPYYKQSAEKYVKYETEDADHRDQRIDIHPRKLSALSEQDRKILLQWIEDNNESITLVQQGNEKTYCWREYGRTDENYTEELIAINIPHLAEFKKLAQLLCLQGLFNAEKTNFEKSFADLSRVYSFGSHLRGRNTSIIEQLVSMSIENLSIGSYFMVLDEYGKQISASQLNEAKALLSEMIENEDFRIDYGLEKMFMYDEAQRCFTYSRFGKSHLYLPRLKQLSSWYFSQKEVEVWAKRGLHVLFTHPDKEQTLKDVEQLYSQVEKMAALTPASANAQSLQIKPFVDEVVENNILLSTLLPALTRMSDLSYRTQVKAYATLAVLAVMQYEKEHGEYPQSLDILVEKGLLKEVPIDPFSDKPLVYRKTDNDFILYSVGLNFIDDGGTRPRDRKGNLLNWRDTGDGIFWPVDVQ